MCLIIITSEVLQSSIRSSHDVVSLFSNQPRQNIAVYNIPYYAAVRGGVLSPKDGFTREENYLSREMCILIDSRCYGVVQQMLVHIILY